MTLPMMYGSAYRRVLRIMSRYSNWGLSRLRPGIRRKSKELVTAMQRGCADHRPMVHTYFLFMQALARR